MKHLIILIVICFNVNAVFSQDIIHLKNGGKIEAKVTEIGTKEIKYKKYDFQNGPDYVIYKKETAYILYENGKKESFYGKYTEAEYKALCERKVIKFTNQKRIGAGLATIGIIGFALIAVDNYNYKINNPNSYNYDKDFTYMAGYSLSAAAIAGGAVMYFMGKYKTHQYSEKLKGISFGFNFNEKQRIFSLAYRF